MLDQDSGVQILLVSEVWTGSFQGEVLEGGGTEPDGKEESCPHLEQGEVVGLDSCCFLTAALLFFLEVQCQLQPSVSAAEEEDEGIAGSQLRPCAPTGTTAQQLRNRPNEDPGQAPQGKDTHLPSQVCGQLVPAGCSRAKCAQSTLTHLFHKAREAALITHGLQEVCSRLYLFCALCVHSPVLLEGLSE